jgi:hypothetical protein
MQPNSETRQFKKTMKWAKYKRIVLTDHTDSGLGPTSISGVLNRRILLPFVGLNLKNGQNLALPLRHVSLRYHPKHIKRNLQNNAT